MNDNEIIKALECCQGDEHCSEECPYYSKVFKEKLSCLDEKEGLITMALDLITRQKADLKQKDTEIDILIRKNERLKDEVSELRETILKGDFTSITARRANELWYRKNCEKIDGLKAEIERLKAPRFLVEHKPLSDKEMREALKKSHLGIVPVGETTIKRIDEEGIKAAARKEFAERLKCGVPQETGVIRCADIDKLLAEMEERG